MAAASPLLALAVALIALPFVVQAIGQPALVPLATRADLCHRRREPQSRARFRRHGQFRPCAPSSALAAMSSASSTGSMTDDAPSWASSPARTSFLITLPAALVIGGLFACVIGALSLRTSGVQFIMITLAFAQMLFFLFVSLKAYGGDDGLTIRRRNALLFSLNTRDDITFYFICLVIAALRLPRALAHRRLALRHGAGRHPPERAAHGGDRYRALSLQARRPSSFPAWAPASPVR